MEAILRRRSIRQYTGEKISEEIIETLLRAAMSAPSANNIQPWHFIIIDDRKTLDAIPKFHPYSKMLTQAPLAILVCGDTKAVMKPEYIYLDCSAATQNILIAAHTLGLGAVWLGIYPREERIEGIKNLMMLPEHIEPIALISLGHPAESKEPSNRFTKSKVKYNHW
ncbi:MAG: nitroreductase family protein [candidate division Zixibacteria bacterium]